MNLPAPLVKHPLIFSSIFGAAMPFGFAPFNIYVLPPILLVGLFLIWSQQSAVDSGKAGFCFAFSMHCVGTSWVFISLNTYGDMPLPLAIICVAGFIAVLSLFPMLAGWFQARFIHTSIHIRLLLVIPAIWTLFEYVRNHILTGFSWLELGYSQTDSWLGALGSVIGIHGVTLAVAILAGCIALIGTDFRRYGLQSTIAATALFVAGFVIQNIDWGKPHGDHFRADLVQLNVPLTTKWSIQQRRNLIDKYLNISQANDNDSDVVVWPESSIPAFVDQLDSEFHRDIKNLGRPLISGFLERRHRQGGVEYFNAAVLFDQQPAIYRKQHLVPFGEYTPFLWLFGSIAEYFEIPMSEMSAWTGDQKNMIVAGRNVGMGICYEDAFPYDVLRTMPDAELLMNISEDAWFGNSFGPHQRLQMARMRSIEVERPMLRVSNTGLSAAIDHKGRLLQVSPQFEEYVLNAEVQPRSGMTPYTNWRDWPVLLLILCIIGYLLIKPHRIKTNKTDY